MTAPFPDPNQLTRLERELFRSLSEDEPPRQARRRVASALGISVLALTRDAAAASLTPLSGGSKVGSVLVLKWLGIGLFAGAISAGGASYALGPVPVASPHVLAARSAAISRAPGARSTATTDRTLPTELDDSTLASGGAADIRGELPTVQRSASGERQRSEPEAAPEKLTRNSTSSSSLAAEIALLDRVRGALGANDAGAAQLLLNQFAHEFPEATLRLEARVFLVEALLMQGNSARATALGEEILRSNATGTHARRIRYLLSKSQKP